MASPARKNNVATVRRFSRFYTRQMGVLNQTLLGSSYSLTEVRILFEIAHAGSVTAGELARHLGLDAGYLSRLLRGFARQDLLAMQRNPRDARQTFIALSAAGRRVFRQLDQAADRQVAMILRHMAEADRRRLLAALEAVMAVWPDP